MRMFNKSLHKFRYSFSQDTIQVPTTSQDSSAIKPSGNQAKDTARLISSEPNDTVSTGKIHITKKELVPGGDSSKTSLKKSLIITQEISLNESRDHVAEAEREELLSWKTPENFAKEIFSPYTGSTVVYHSFTTDTVVPLSEMKQKESTFFKRLQTNTDWIFWTYIIIALLFVWIQVFYRKYFNNLFNSSINYHMSSKLFKEKNILVKRVSVVLNFIYAVSVSLVIFKFIQYLGFKSDTFDRFSLFLFILNMVILYSMLKLIVQKIIGYVFSRIEQINDYLHNVYVYNKILGIVLLPLSFAAFYTQNRITEILLLITIVFFLFSVLFKIIRGFQIIIKNDVFILYTILYLCTLEILPIMIGYKILKTLA